VVAVHDVGATGDGGVFVCMEFVRGTTLRHEVARLRGDKPHPWREIVSRYVDAGRGLAAAHQSGLVHRDFKPDNVLVDRSGCVKVGDFGLASLVGQAAAPPDEAAEASLANDTPLSRPLTTVGSVLGTPAYMAPEQHRGEMADHRADQFAFCVSLYEALYGELPFPGRTREQYLANIISENLRKPPASTTVPAWVHRALVRGLKPDAADRYPSMDELLNDIHFDPSDARVGVRTRVFLASIAGLLFTLAPIVLWLADAASTVEDFFASDVVLLVLVGALSLWGRESLFKSDYNRAFASSVLFVLVAHIPLSLSAHLLGLSANSLAALHVFLWFLASGLASLIVEPRFAWTSVTYLGAFFVMAAWPQYQFPAFIVGNVVLTLNALILWAPEARGASPQHHHEKTAS
jgi:serine/threonine protein kinase